METIFTKPPFYSFCQVEHHVQITFQFEYYSGAAATMAFAPKEVVAKELARMEAEREAAAKRMEAVNKTAAVNTKP